MTREPHPIDAVLPTLGDFRKIAEIGCHRMEDTTFLRSLFPLADIYAFEPDHRNIAFIAEKRLDVTVGVYLYELAIGNRDAVVPFFRSTNRAPSLDEEWTRSGSLRKPVSNGDEALLAAGTIPCVFEREPVAVACMRLDTFFDDIGYAGALDLIWCDAQGAEDMIIEGAKATIARTRYLFLEHNTNGCYEGAPDAGKLIRMLPGWQVMHTWPQDMLLRNTILQ